jgi:hypothetical protein
MPPAAHPLYDAELAAFDRDGFVRLPAAFPREAAIAMQAEWWAELAALCGARRDDASTWRPRQLDLKGPKRAASQRAIETAHLKGAIDALIGADAWDWPKDWGRPIVTFPSGAPHEAWDVPQGWHWDGRSDWNVPRLTTLFVVACVGEMLSGGGATVVVAGSHRVVAERYDPLPADRRALGETWRRDRLMRDHPWFAQLSGHAPGPADRIGAFMGADGPLRVVELTGEPGDVYVCHPLLIHSPAPNCRDQPRMVRIKQQLLSREAQRLVKDETDRRSAS